ncbi:MAG: hypothetical protein JNN27_08615 [Planctomycetes bacterium]|nr:hypothetical protein [Planctomycetota bacterium]
MIPHRKAHTVSVLALLCLGVAACIAGGHDRARQRMWWSGLGPVLPHDTFPADCSLCHVGESWTELVDDFEFDHEAETGVALNGAHAGATCLRCHNDRGPVAVFERQGCGGCHEDVHFGRLGSGCATCHVEHNWYPVGQIELHRNTRFPLIGVHASTACRRCHPGAEVGQFVPTDTECVTCHLSDLQRATNPNHIGLGWTQNCDQCHQPRTWNNAEIDN